LPSIIITFVGAKLKNIKGRDIAPKLFLPSEFLPQPLSDKGWFSVLQKPVGIPGSLSQRRLAIYLVKGPVGLLAVRAAILQELSFRKVHAAQERRIAHANTYHHEITVLATIPADFLAISAIQIPVCADELRGCHCVVLLC